MTKPCMKIHTYFSILTLIPRLSYMPVNIYLMMLLFRTRALFPKFHILSLMAFRRWFGYSAKSGSLSVFLEVGSRWRCVSRGMTLKYLLSFFLPQQCEHLTFPTSLLSLRTHWLSMIWNLGTVRTKQISSLIKLQVWGICLSN